MKLWMGIVLAGSLLALTQCVSAGSRFLDSVGDDMYRLPDGRVLNRMTLQDEGYLTRDAETLYEPDRGEAANAFYRETFPEIYAYAAEHGFPMAGDMLESSFSYRMLLARSPHNENKDLWSRWQRYYRMGHCLANFIPQPVITAGRHFSLNQYRGMHLFDMTDLYFRDLRAWFLGEPVLFVQESLFPRNQVFFDFFGTGMEGWKKYVDYFYLQGHVTGADYQVLELFPRDNWRKKEPETFEDFDILLRTMEERFTTRAGLLDQAGK